MRFSQSTDEKRMTKRTCVASVTQGLGQKLKGDFTDLAVPTRGLSSRGSGALHTLHGRRMRN